MLLLLGDEAIAQGAIDAGISGVYAYPGTPSTEIAEYIQHAKETKEQGIHSSWSANEKTAMEAALGMSYAGKRALVCMKHVGLNVAADAFVNSAITGTNGGLVVLLADDPSMHSSQNEQDSRFYAKFSMVPVFEPSSQQEAYDMVRSSFELSERLKVPVMLRITTRLAHSRSGVITQESLPQNQLKAVESDSKQFILLPAIARRSYKDLLNKQVLMEEAAEASVYNHYTDGKDKSRGVIACGIAYNYYCENYPDVSPYPLYKLSQYPMPSAVLNKMVEECDELVVLEEGMPVLEELIKGASNVGPRVRGRLDGTLPRDGELDPDIVARAFGLQKEVPQQASELVAMRPPSLCQGCGHIDMYQALNEVVRRYDSSRVFSDIGCYTLGALPPYQAINSCVDMGASVTMAKGAADSGLYPAIAVIGDSTFTHSGMTGLLDAVNDNSNIVVVISDNETTAMTGGQKSAGTGRLEAICAGIGVDPAHIRVFVPLKKNYEEMTKIIQEELEYEGVSVLIPRRECIQVSIRKKKKSKK